MARIQMTQPTSTEWTLQDVFPTITYDEWRANVEQSLKGAAFDRKLVTHTPEGIDIQPVHTSRDMPGDVDPMGFPGIAPFIRGSRALGISENGWDLCQEHSHPDLNVAREDVREDVNCGATWIALQWDEAACWGMDPVDAEAAELAGRGGLLAYSVQDLEMLFGDLDLSGVGVSLQAGAAFLPAASILAALWRRRNISPADVRGAFNADPLATWSRRGSLPIPAAKSLSMLTDLADWTSKTYPRVTSVAVDTSPYHEAGSTATQDLAFAIATGVEYLRALTRAGMAVDKAAAQMLFHFRVGTRHFLSIAKLRAARHLWSRVVTASGGSSVASAMCIQARVADRVLTRRDPHVNLLRNTMAVFAAGVGGAQIVTSVPFDALLGFPGPLGRRIARNTSHILQDEVHLHRVVDPAGGSWYLDRVTDQLAEKAWEIFQQIERQGGMLACLESGWIAGQVGEAYARRALDVARRKQGITGVSEFPDIHEPSIQPRPPDRNQMLSGAISRLKRIDATAPELASLKTNSNKSEHATQAALTGASLGQIARALGFHAESVRSVPSLVARRFAEPFEALRDACDRWKVQHGQRPRIFLVKLGPVSHHSARVTYSKNFFEAGGFEAVESASPLQIEEVAAAFRESGAAIAVVCSSDKLYPEFVPLAARALKGAGATSVVLAGNPGENEATWRAAGVDRFIFVGCDVLESLRELLRTIGVS